MLTLFSRLKILKLEHCTKQVYVNNRYLYADVALELHTQEHAALTSLPAMQW
jgi:hypothetical protein